MPERGCLSADLTILLSLFPVSADLPTREHFPLLLPNPAPLLSAAHGVHSLHTILLHYNNVSILGQSPPMCKALNSHSTWLWRVTVPHQPLPGTAGCHSLAHSQGLSAAAAPLTPLIQLLPAVPPPVPSACSSDSGSAGSGKCCT